MPLCMCTTVHVQLMALTTPYSKEPQDVNDNDIPAPWTSLLKKRL